jgi:hypothetical protein
MKNVNLGLLALGLLGSVSGANARTLAEKMKEGRYACNYSGNGQDSTQFEMLLNTQEPGVGHNIVLGYIGSDSALAQNSGLYNCMVQDGNTCFKNNEPDEVSLQLLTKKSFAIITNDYGVSCRRIRRQ